MVTRERTSGANDDAELPAFLPGGRAPRGRAGIVQIEKDQYFATHEKTGVRRYRGCCALPRHGHPRCREFRTSTPTTSPPSRSSRRRPTETSTGAYVVNGDEVISNQGELRSFYEQLLGADPVTNGLIVNTVNSIDDKWSDAQASALTYCVSTAFGARHADVVSAMESGAALWEAASSKIDFIYDSSADANCTTRNNAVLFSVEPVQTTQYIARAFFPSTAPRLQNVLIDDSIWTPGSSWTPTNVLGHELGHVLGFRPRAHPPRGRHLLRGQQLASADAV